jgi:hypothetical protein
VLVRIHATLQIPMPLPSPGRVLLGVLISGAVLSAQDYPSTHISNGVLSADFYLPDAIRGSYRATRFDWSGIIRSLAFRGHTYFGQWYDSHDPLVNDAITGPVNIFDAGGPATGYAEAKPGETFLRIGVGHLLKPDESGFSETTLYQIADPGTWNIEQKPGLIRFTQRLAPRRGYGYTYVKTIFFSSAEMTLSQELKNTGSKAIDTKVFNHGFFQLDREPAGPGLMWTFPFAPRAKGDFKRFAEIRGHSIAYLQEVKPGERVLTQVEGFGNSAADHQFSLENLKTGAGVRVTGDRHIEKMTFWSRRMGYSPEITIRLHLAPGETEKWITRYQFYVVPGRER